METGITFKTFSSTRPAEDLYEYMLVIQPDQSVKEKLLHEKTEFSNTYWEDKSGLQDANMILASFRAKEGLEETIIRWIERICGQQKSFRVTLNNYSGIPPHTIFLRTQDADPFCCLSKQLKVIDDLVNYSGYPSVQIYSKPYLAIAGKLPADVFDRALMDYAHRTFHESFQVHELILLKRVANGEISKKINVFRLQASVC
jgi:hypothetical protein